LFNEFVDLEEVEYTDEKMIIFVQRISKEVRKWFKYLSLASIQDFTSFERLFLNKWGDKKNPL
jgi:hypothetical protein